MAVPGQNFGSLDSHIGTFSTTSQHAQQLWEGRGRIYFSAEIWKSCNGKSTLWRLFRILQVKVNKQSNTARKRKKRSMGVLLGKNESFLEIKKQSSLGRNLQFLDKGAIGLFGGTVLKWWGSISLNTKMLGIPCSRSLDIHIVLTHCDNPKHPKSFPNVTTPSLEPLSINMGCLGIGIILEKAESRVGSDNEKP